MKNKTLAIIFDPTVLSVGKNVNPLQLALFGLGYKWNRFDTQPVVIKFPAKQCVIYLNTETKSLSWDNVVQSNVKAVGNYSYTSIRLTGNNLSEVLDFVEHPVKPKTDVTIEELHDDRSIKFVVDTDAKTVKVNLVKRSVLDRDIVHDFEVSTDTLDRVQECLGHSTVFPVVRFTYPSSSTGLPVERIIRVTFANDVYVRGYELAEVTDDKGTFKAFQQKKIRGKVELISFHKSEE